jgi:hypothetical protein
LTATTSDPHRPALIAAAIALGAALQVNDGFYAIAAILLVCVSVALTWSAVLFPKRMSQRLPDTDRLVVATLLVGLAAQLIVLMRAPIGQYLARPFPVSHAGFVPGLMAAAMAAGLAAIASRPVRIAMAVLLVAVHVWLGVLTYRGSPSPRIDVVTVHEAAFDALRQRQSPYSITFPDLYKGKQAFYPPGMVVDGQVMYGFPYPPLSLVMAWAGERFGDFRYAELAALAVTGLSIAAASGFSPAGVLSMALLLFTPRVFFTLEQAWTEPLVLAWVAAAVCLWCRGRLNAGAVAIGLAVATKQYAVLAIPLAALVRDGARAWWRLPALAGAVAAAAMLPALVWDAGGFLHSAVSVQVRERLRFDALSLAVTYAHVTGVEPSELTYVIVPIAALALSLWRAPRTPAGFTAALAAVLVTTFAVGKKAFCNYYFFVLALQLLAVAAFRPKELSLRSRTP